MTITADKNAKIELEHILLELNNGRSHHMRHFIDQYFCYKNGYINRNCGAKWDAIGSNEFVSVTAMHSNDVTRDHIIPLRCIVIEMKQMNELKSFTIRSLSEFLDRWVYFGRITKKDNENLCESGLKFTMPYEFYDESHELFGHPLARYEKAKIKCRLGQNAQSRFDMREVFAGRKRLKPTPPATVSAN